MENESRKRSREEEAWSEAGTSAHSFTYNSQAPYAQPPPPLFASGFTEAFENSNARPWKRLREGARMSEQVIAPALQETDTCATNDAEAHHLQIAPYQANTFQGWNEGLGDYGMYGYSPSVGMTPDYDIAYNPGMIASNDRGSNDQFRTAYFIPPGAAQNMASALQGAHNFIVRDQACIMSVGTISNVNNYGQLFGLDIMYRFMEQYVSHNATHDSPVQDPDRICHPETRRNVLKQIRDWADNPDGTEGIFWLRRPAGVGKSAIAQTIARSYDRQKVAATFFFFRSDPSRNDGNKLFTTIAWQLAILIPTIRTHLINALNERPDLPRKDVETQFRELIVKPFQALASAHSQTRLSGLVIIIDGIDECVDEKLQRRFLKAIGNAVNEPDFPLRFLICSRPEAHIEETIDSFQCPPLQLDLAELDDANHEIEKYLRAEFSRIASKQGLDPTWPDDERIETCVYKSSGHFVYASTVIKIVDDDYNSATTQLDIVLGLKPHGEKSPFAELDSLYMEMLERQRDWGFLYNILSILIGDHLSGFKIYNDTNEYAILVNTPEKELCMKLRGMRSLLKLDPYVNVYHLSFLDFLQDSSRSDQYHINQQTAQRRYLDLITASIVRYIPIVFEQPDRHEQHLSLKISLEQSSLSVEEVQNALQPLVHIQDKLLRMKNSSLQRLLQCSECNILSIIRYLLLFLKCYQETSNHTTVYPAQATVEQDLNGHPSTFGSLAPFNATEEVQTSQTVLEKLDLDVCLSLVLDQLRKLEFPPSKTTIHLMCSIFSFNHVETAMRVRSMSDGQLLMDFIDYLINKEDFLRQRNTAAIAILRSAAHLALEVHARVPVLSRSLFCPGNPSQNFILEDHFSESLFTPMFMGRILDHNYVLRASWISRKGRLKIVHDNINTYQSIGEWRQSNPDPVMMTRVMLRVAKALQYIDSMDILLHDLFDLDSIFLDSESCVKIFPWGHISSTLVLSSDEVHRWNIFNLGKSFYELWFNVILHLSQLHGLERPPEPKISKELWQVTQRCCAGDQKSRPTIDEIVQEMESWRLD